MQLFLCFWIPSSPPLPRSSPVPSHARSAARRCAGRKAGKTPTNFSGAAPMPIAGRSCRMRTVNPKNPREKAAPSEHPCPVCGRPHYSGKNDRGTYWACYNKQGYSDGNNVFLPDDNGTPGQPKEKSPRVVTEFPCPDCGKALLYRQGTSKAGKPYEVFSCSGYPNCKTSFWGKDGKPDFNRRPK